MKKSIIIFSAILFAAACNTDVDNIVVNDVIEYDENSEYYVNLRKYKESDHAICFGWYAAYTNEASPSAGNHFTGLPDSMDVVSLWQQIPSNNPEYTETSYYNERYLPTAWEEMQYIRRVKGTKVVMCKICHLTTSGFPLNDEGMREYAMWLVRCVLRNDLDGLDLDYEPTGQTFGTDYIIGDKFTEFVKIIGEYLGPQSGSGKLLIVDYAGDTVPSDVEPYIDYLVRQCYSVSSSSGLDSRIPSWCPPEKFIPTEQMGWYWQNGGVAFTEADGNTVDSWGNPLYSVIGMARWNPSTGRKGGFGGYYFEYEYNTTRPANSDIGDTGTTPMPYYSLRRGIQEQNPARQN